MYTTVYPTNIVTLTSLPVQVDDVDDVEARTVNDPVTELIAVQAELGMLPKGAHATVKARLDALEMTSRARAYRAGAPVVITSGTWTKVPLDGETFDNLGEYDAITNFRFTATKAGCYQVNGGVWILLLVASVTLYACIYKNGSIHTNSKNASSSTPYGCALVSDIVQLAVGDYIELYIYHSAGSNRTMYGPSDKTFMSIHQLS